MRSDDNNHLSVCCPTSNSQTNDCVTCSTWNHCTACSSNSAVGVRCEMLNLTDYPSSLWVTDSLIKRVQPSEESCCCSMTASTDLFHCHPRDRSPLLIPCLICLLVLVLWLAGWLAGNPSTQTHNKTLDNQEETTERELEREKAELKVLM